MKTINQSELTQLQTIANTMRGLSVDAIEAAGCGHPGLPLGCAEIMAFLYAKALRYNPKNPNWINRDRFILSAGHGSMALYSALHLAGFNLPIEELKKFRQLDSLTPGHPEYGHTEGVETTTGPLGQGFANAVGMALGHKLMAAQFEIESERLLDARTVVLAGDGCMMEGITSEAASLAGHLKLNNVIAIYDANNICLDGPISDCFSEDVAKRFNAYGWRVLKIDGHNFLEIAAAVSKAYRSKDKPVLIIAKTIIGKGAPLAGTSEVHGKALGAIDAAKTKAFFGLSAEPFFVPQEVYDYFQGHQKKLSATERQWQKRLNQWANWNPEKYQKWQQYLEKKLPVDFDSLVAALNLKPDSATRSSSQEMIGFLSGQLPYIIGGSADLSCSDNTAIKGEAIVSPTNYKGRNIKYGVREFAMAAITSGLALHGMIVPFCGTFLVFSDYMRNAIRMAALMRLKVIYVFTHDSILVGEDGPTHQPVEQVASLRAIPNLTVIRPADAKETKGAWLAALKVPGPVALILSRQKCKSLTETRVSEVEKGAYIIKKESRTDVDLCLISTGSELDLALTVANRLETESRYCVRVVSMPSTSLFEKQPQTYHNSILGGSIKQFAVIEALSSFGWHKYVGQKGILITQDQFGLSAPEPAIRKKTGFTSDAIYQNLKSELEKI